MADLLSGTEAAKADGRENMEKKQAKEEQPKTKAAKPQIQEEELLFDKTWSCPICRREFKNKTVKTGRVRMLRTDVDLRPVYDGFEPLKYGVIMCPFCGYTALERYFTDLTAYEKKAIIEQVCAIYKPVKEEKTTYSYEDALERYKMALLNTVIKGGKPSERAYICMKTAWLLRSEGENLLPDGLDDEKKKAEIARQERDFMKNAMEGFLEARQTENFPICGMDESTVDYLLVNMCMQFGEYDTASKLLGEILASATAGIRVKEKARDLKEELAKKMKEKQ